MSQVTVAEPDETSDPAPRLELSRVQMNVVFVTILLGLLLSAARAGRSGQARRDVEGVADGRTAGLAGGA